MLWAPVPPPGPRAAPEASPRCATQQPARSSPGAKGRGRSGAASGDPLPPAEVHCQPLLTAQPVHGRGRNNTGHFQLLPQRSCAPSLLSLLRWSAGVMAGSPAATWQHWLQEPLEGTGHPNTGQPPHSPAPPGSGLHVREKETFRFPKIAVTLHLSD